MGFSSMWCCVKGGSDGKNKVKNDSKWRVYSLKELQSATNNFNYDNKLGEGRVGSVYWGQHWDGSQIAVKRFKSWNEEEYKDYSVEVEILARARHKNLLSLRGYCAEGQERLIVYDYMTNLSLQSHLHGQHSAECQLTWTRRMSIAIGAADGIAYLHHHATPCVVHGDIKASNVLLDAEFNPRVSDFVFSKFVSNGDDKVSFGIKGYRAPEYGESGVDSQSCDVFSFGIVLLEVASGKKPNVVRDWALPLACESRFGEIADPRMDGRYVEEELKRVVFVGLVCSDSRPEKRPTMVDVAELLRGGERFAALENGGVFRHEIGTSA